MNCGGHMLSGFTCGARRFDKYKFTTADKPSNTVLHQENQKKLNDLIRLREEQDKGIFQPILTPAVSSIAVSPITISPNVASGNIQLTNMNYSPFIDTSLPIYYPTSDVSYKCKKE